MAKPLSVDACSFEESRFLCGDGRYWMATTLYEAASAQGVRPFKLPLRHLDLAVKPWNGDRFCDFIYHAQRAKAADLSKPVILSPVGVIMDGFHRILKAAMTNRDHVLAYRLKEMPPCDGTESE